jgi:hypothetical protein
MDELKWSKYKDPPRAKHIMGIKLQQFKLFDSMVDKINNSIGLTRKEQDRELLSVIKFIDEVKILEMLKDDVDPSPKGCWH